MSTLLKQLDPLMDARCGILNKPIPLPFPPGFEGHMFGFSSSIGQITALHPKAVSATLDMAGYGTAWDETTARIRACCEALERYCSVMYPLRGVVSATTRELGDAALDPSRLPQCSVRERLRANPEHRLRIPDPAAEERWVEGFSLTTGKPAWIPLSVAYLGLPDPLSAQLLFPESTGFATGSTYEGAILSGLCEVIERDSLALWWLHQLPMPRIERSVWDGAPELAELLDRADRSGLETHLLDLTTDLGIPIVGLVQISNRSSPHVVAMGACRTTTNAAALRVVEEAGSLRVALGWSKALPNPEGLRSGAPRSPMDFGLLYAGTGAPEKFSFATRRSPKTSKLSGNDIRSKPLETMVRGLATKDLEVFVVDVTLPEVRAAGLVVVRVIVPELMRISFAHSIRYLAHPRLYSAPERMGFGRRSEDMITDEPIPFA
ncbi:YcaO-like family protein [Rhizobium rhizogenes]|uniref:YcaO-like family protein n=1 Tax=Rhizobium rhizogenes TaxID=359 RepID=UPI001572A360|nr:YcaO-like family protein [Rhizobium rhizogenes]NTI39355.1 YcaO-like family protein [Rhizobium rhizogenes]WEO69270.1 YcaO-like family protein [Rhizobium rhizogenes]